VHFSCLPSHPPWLHHCINIWWTLRFLYSLHFNWAPLHEGVLGSGDIAPPILRVQLAAKLNIVMSFLVWFYVERFQKATCYMTCSCPLPFIVSRRLSVAFVMCKLSTCWASGWKSNSRIPDCGARRSRTVSCPRFWNAQHLLIPLQTLHCASRVINTMYSVYACADGSGRWKLVSAVDGRLNSMFAAS
jgi:hypothetical protein